jgi:hypothetical protein
MKLIHGFATDFQHLLNRRSCLVTRQLLLERQTRRDADCQSGVMLDILQIEAPITWRHTLATCSSRCNVEGAYCGSRAIPLGRLSGRRQLPKNLGDPESWRS